MTLRFDVRWIMLTGHHYRRTTADWSTCLTQRPPLAARLQRSRRSPRQEAARLGPQKPATTMNARLSGPAPGVGPLVPSLPLRHARSRISGLLQKRTSLSDAIPIRM